MKLSRHFLIAMVCASAIVFPIFSIQNYADNSEIFLDLEDQTGSQEGFRQVSEAPKRRNSPGPAPCVRVSLAEIGGNYAYVTIKTPNVPRLTGNLGGVQGIYEYRPINFLYAAVKGMWRQGNTTGSGAERSLIDIDAHQRLGYTWSSRCEKYVVTAFSGVGYRYLGEKLTQNGAFLHQNYSEFYVPVGLLTEYKFKSWFSVGLNGIWMPQVDATVNLLPLDAARWIIKKKIGNFLVELPLCLTAGCENQYTFVLKPFYEFWQDSSTTATVFGVPLGLPGNTYRFWGAEFNMGYKF